MIFELRFKLAHLTLVRPAVEPNDMSSLAFILGEYFKFCKLIDEVVLYFCTYRFFQSVVLSRWEWDPDGLNTTYSRT